LRIGGLPRLRRASDVEKCTLRPIARQYFNISLAIVRAEFASQSGRRLRARLYSLADNAGA